MKGEKTRENPFPSKCYPSVRSGLVVRKKQEVAGGQAPKVSKYAWTTVPSRSRLCFRSKAEKHASSVIVE